MAYAGRHFRFANTRSDSRRIVLLGKTGSGKSSLANTIFGVQYLFPVCHSSFYGTMHCQSEIKRVQGRNVQLIDTPGLFDTDPNAPDFKEEILDYMIRCVSGVHAFLLVLKVERFTKHELSVAEVFCQHFSEEALKYTTVVFTQGDQIEEGETINEWIQDNEALKTLVQRCGGRCHVVDNKYWNNSQDPYRNNQLQVKALLKTIDKTVKKNRGRCYTNENLESVQEKLQQERAMIRSAPKYANLSEQDVNQMAKQNTFKYFWPIMVTLFGVVGVVGVVAGAGGVSGVAALLGAVLLRR